MTTVIDLNGEEVTRDTTTDLVPVEVFDFRVESGGTATYPDGPIAPWYQGPQGIQGPKGDQGIPGPYGEAIIPYARTGIVTVASGKQRFQFPAISIIKGISAAIDTAPVGAAINFNIARNGIVVSSHSIAAGSNALADTPVSISVAAGDYITVNVTQVGSTTNGSDLSIFIRYERQ